MTGLRARPWQPQPDEAARELHARYAPGADPGLWQTLRAAAETMPRTARLLAMAAIVVVGWPVVMMIGGM